MAAITPIRKVDDDLRRDHGMTESQRRLWLAVRRALLMIAAAIEREVGKDAA